MQLIIAQLSCSCSQVAVAVQLATEMALNSKVGCLFGHHHTFLESPTSVAIAIEIWDLGNFVTWEFRILEIWNLGNLRPWKFAVAIPLLQLQPQCC